MEYVTPKFNKDRFTCPHCNTVAHQLWANHIRANKEISTSKSAQDYYIKYSYYLSDLKSAKCEYCDKYSLWIKEKMIYPRKANVPEPNEDMPESVKKDYVEASKIVNDSPRSACALLRVALEKLMIELGYKKGNLYEKINNFVGEDKGSDLEHSLTSVRVIGNDCVHSGVLDIKDNKPVAVALFNIINYIIEDTITKKRKIDEIYNIIPDSKKLKKSS